MVDKYDIQTLGHMDVHTSTVRHLTVRHMSLDHVPHI